MGCVTMLQVKRTGVIPPEHVSHDHLNEQKDVPIDDAAFQKWKQAFERIEQEHIEKGECVKWVMVDGFLLYWHQVSVRGLWEKGADVLLCRKWLIN